MTGEARRRWVSEQAVLDEMERLNDASVEKVQEFTDLAPQAAEAEAVHKALRAKRVLKAKAPESAGGDGVRSIAEAEYVAEADPDVSAAYLNRLVLAAQVEACREALRTMRTSQEALRTAAASARDQISGPGWSGRS